MEFSLTLSTFVERASGQHFEPRTRTKERRRCSGRESERLGDAPRSRTETFSDLLLVLRSSFFDQIRIAAETAAPQLQPRSLRLRGGIWAGGGIRFRIGWTAQVIVYHGAMHHRDTACCGHQRWQAAALIIASLLIVPARSAHADAIVVTKAMTASTVVEVFIEESEIRVELEIGVPDLAAFHNVLPDEIRQRMGMEPEPLRQRLGQFFTEDFVIRADGGPPLPGRVTAIEPRRRVARDEITGEPLPATEDEGEPVIHLVLEYEFSGEPKTLTFHPPTAGGAYPTATIGFITYHLGLPVMDFRYLGAEEVLRLDWKDPWFSKFDNRNLWRQYDSPINVFLYVEPYEVRVEIIARPIDVQNWVDLGLDARGKIPVALQEEIKQQVADFFAEHLDLTIDGEKVEPALDRVNFLNRTLRTSTVISPPRELEAASATLGVIFLQPTPGYPDEVTVTWGLFTPRIQRIPGAATDEAGPLRFFLQPDDNILWWKNFLKNPTMPTLVDIAPPPSTLQRALIGGGWLAALVLAALTFRRAVGAAKGRGSWMQVALPAAVLLVIAGGTLAATRSASLSDDRAEEIISSLLTNIYRAFDFRDEDIIYDTLDRSLSGDMLDETYLSTRRSLELASQGGARAKVQSVEMIEVDAHTEGKGFVARSTWNVAASVGHWGHIHQRRNQYVADLTVEPVDGVWKVTAMELLEEEQL